MINIEYLKNLDDFYYIGKTNPYKSYQIILDIYYLHIVMRLGFLYSILMIF
jgi:hypothetical protein